MAHTYLNQPWFQVSVNNDVIPTCRIMMMSYSVTDGSARTHVETVHGSESIDAGVNVCVRVCACVRVCMCMCALGMCVYTRVGVCMCMCI